MHNEKRWRARAREACDTIWDEFKKNPNGRVNAREFDNWLTAGSTAELEAAALAAEAKRRGTKQLHGAVHGAAPSPAPGEALFANGQHLATARRPAIMPRPSQLPRDWMVAERKEKAAKLTKRLVVHRQRVASVRHVQRARAVSESPFIRHLKRSTSSASHLLLAEPPPPTCPERSLRTFWLHSPRLDGVPTTASRPASAGAAASASRVRHRPVEKGGLYAGTFCCVGAPPSLSASTQQLLPSGVGGIGSRPRSAAAAARPKLESAAAGGPAAVPQLSIPMDPWWLTSATWSYVDSRREKLAR